MKSKQCLQKESASININKTSESRKPSNLLHFYVTWIPHEVLAETHPGSLNEHFILHQELKKA